MGNKRKKYLWDEDLYTLKITNVNKENLKEVDLEDYRFYRWMETDKATILIDMHFTSDNIGRLETNRTREFFKIIKKDDYVMFAFLFTHLKSIRSHTSEGVEYVIQGCIPNIVKYRASFRYKNRIHPDKIVTTTTTYINEEELDTEAKENKWIIEHPYQGGGCSHK